MLSLGGPTFKKEYLYNITKNSNFVQSLKLVMTSLVFLKTCFIPLHLENKSFSLSHVTQGESRMQKQEVFTVSSIVLLLTLIGHNIDMVFIYHSQFH